ncbi:MAG: hypothetical protein OYH77_03125 [Pseudomonadota bacterium]|nr:hypothetical protein [Pseudomonadota bacterium]
MHVTWRRPDGFHNSTPSDFRVLNVDDSTNIWVHRVECDYYPFQISGGWQEEEATRRLNQFVNLLVASDDAWLDYILKEYDNSLDSSGKDFYQGLIAWFGDLAIKIKGDKWEVEIVGKVIAAISVRLTTLQANFTRRINQ